jgi:hypothetical protein
MSRRIEAVKPKNSRTMERARRILRAASLFVGVAFMLPAHFAFQLTRNPEIRLGALALFLVGALLILVKIVATIVLNTIEFRAK